MARMIYRLMDGDSWQAFKSCGCFDGSADDRRDGFIHFSTADTVRETARRYYADIADLVLLRVDAHRLGPALKWEAARGGILFPHLYASLPIALVEEAIMLTCQNGQHDFGATLA